MKAREKITKSKNKPRARANPTPFSKIDRLGSLVMKEILKRCRTGTRELRRRTDQALHLYERFITGSPFKKAWTPPPPDQL